MMDEISKEEYEETVRLFGVVLFKGGPVDRNPKSIEEGFYEDYRFINLYEKKETKGVDRIEKDYKLIQSKQFSSFMDAVRVLHLFEHPPEWKEMDFWGKVVKNGTQRLGPIYKLMLVNRKTPFRISI
jgi:ribosome-interacting GTPase 1